MDKTVHLQYFAILREQRGADRETLTTQAATLRDQLTELKAMPPFDEVDRPKQKPNARPAAAGGGKTRKGKQR